MNDRFKFRVWITAPITRDVEEEKEVSFYIYDITLYDDGGIGFSRDSLLDALDKLNLTEGQRNEIEDYISDNSYSEDWEWYAISFDIIEQCTGLKDRNQKLIYEGDILDFDLSTPKNGGHYRGFIRWQKRNDLIGWMISDMDMAGDWDLRQIAHPNDWMVWGEIIGNIHKNRELLEFNPEDYDIRV